MDKRDLKKELGKLYNPSAKEAVRVDVPEMNFLMVDGEGDPNRSGEYAEAVEALFAASYALKFAVRKGSLAVDYGVLPLEGLWWADDMSVFSSGDKSSWKWTMMIMQPDLVTSELVEATLAGLAKKKDAVALGRLRFESFAEGLSAQIMHLGPFSEEGPTIAGLHRFIDESGHRRSGKHHEIYLSDIRKAAPQKWRTIIRQPMSPAR
jgi:hypothetical protein